MIGENSTNNNTYNICVCNFGPYIGSTGFVELNPITILTGPNGSGKSSLMDAFKTAVICDENYIKYNPKSPNLTKLDYIKTFKSQKVGPTIIALYINFKGTAENKENILFGVCFDDNTRGRYFIKHGISVEKASEFIEISYNSNHFIKLLKDPKIVGNQEDFREIHNYHHYLHDNEILFYFPTNNETDYRKYLRLVSESIDSLTRGKPLNIDNLKTHFFRGEKTEVELKDTLDKIQQFLVEFNINKEKSEKKKEEYDLLFNFLKIYEIYIENLIYNKIISIKKIEFELKELNYNINSIENKLSRKKQERAWIRNYIEFANQKISLRKLNVKKSTDFEKTLNDFYSNYDKYKDLYLVPLKTHYSRIEALKKKSIRISKKIIEFSEKIDSLEIKIGDNKKEKDDLIKDRKNNKEKIEELISNQELIKEKLDYRREMKITYTNRKTELNQQNKDLEIKYIKLKSMNCNNVDDLDNEIKLLNSEIEDSKKICINLKKENQELDLSPKLEEKSQKFMNYMSNNHKIKRLQDYFEDVDIDDAKIIESVLLNFKNYYILPHDKQYALNHVENYIIDNDINNIKILFLKECESIEDLFIIKKKTHNHILSNFLNKFEFYTEIKPPKFFGKKIREKTIELNLKEIKNLKLKIKKLASKYTEMLEFLTDVKSLKKNIQEKNDSIKKSLNGYTEIEFIDKISTIIAELEKRNFKIFQEVNNANQTEEEFTTKIDNYNNKILELIKEKKEYFKDIDEQKKFEERVINELEEQSSNLAKVEDIKKKQEQLLEKIIHKIKDLYKTHKNVQNYIIELKRGNHGIIKDLNNYNSRYIVNNTNKVRNKKKINKNLNQKLNQIKNSIKNLKIEEKNIIKSKDDNEQIIEKTIESIKEIIEKKLIEEVNILKIDEETQYYLRLDNKVNEKIKMCLNEQLLNIYISDHLIFDNHLLKYKKEIIGILNQINSEYNRIEIENHTLIKEKLIEDVINRFTIIIHKKKFTDDKNMLSLGFLREQIPFDLTKLKIQKYYIKQLDELNDRIRNVSKETATYCEIFIDLIIQQLKKFKKINKEFNMIAKIAEFGELGQIEFAFKLNQSYYNLLDFKKRLQKAELENGLTELIQTVTENPSISLLGYFSLEVFKDKYLEEEKFLDFYQYFNFEINNIKSDGTSRYALKCSGGEGLGLKFLIYALIFHVMRNDPIKPPHRGDIFLYFDEFAALDPKGINSVIEISQKLNIYSILAAVQPPRINKPNIMFYLINKGIIEEEQSNLIMNWEYIND